MNVVIYILLLLGIVSVTLALFRSEKECPPQKVEYRYIPNYELNVVYGEDNMPSKVFSEMFKKSSLWIGGSELGSGKTIASDVQKIKDEHYSKLRSDVIV
jgi:hypothetical protein